ncbi:MAG: aspartate/glutamate racemase family protein [Bryobacteraceae bacterium]|nr:aspartate/glutamate racemase family protein [Bryobacteraceae bacterium]
MKTLALIHTSPVLTPLFAGLARQLLGDTRIFHMVDESLIANTIRTGSLQKDTIRRLVNHVDSAGRAGADAVLVTCSSIGPAVNVARQMFDFPVLRIDEAMAERAVEAGSRIGVIATLNTTLDPTVSLIRETAARMGRSVEVISHLCEGAFQAVISGDTATHDRAVSEGLMKLAGEVDVIVLAQASMARVVDQFAAGQLKVPVLSSPTLAMERARDVLAG